MSTMSLFNCFKILLHVTEHAKPVSFCELTALSSMSCFPAFVSFCGKGSLLVIQISAREAVFIINLSCSCPQFPLLVLSSVKGWRALLPGSSAESYGRVTLALNMKCLLSCHYQMVYVETLWCIKKIIFLWAWCIRESKQSGDRSRMAWREAEFCDPVLH